MTLIDLSVINGVMYYMNPGLYLDLVYILFFNIAWMLISFNNQFYNIYRNARPSKAIYLIIAQFSTFFLAYFTYFGIFKEGDAVNDQLLTLLLIYSLIVVSKLTILVLLKGYRIAGGNYRNVIIIGEDELKNNQVIWKDLSEGGEQELLSSEEVIDKYTNL